MAKKMAIYVGTLGQGIMWSPDGGDTWERAGVEQGMHSDALVRALAVHPRRPEVLFAGTDKGLYRSEDAGKSWHQVDSPLKNYCVWALTVDYKEPGVMFAGTGTPTPPGIFRSIDDGETWEERPMEIAEECEAVGVPRVTGLAIDPANRRDIWVGFEVDGVRRSTDGGDTWTTLNGGIAEIDIHSIAVTEGPPRTAFVVTNKEVYSSTDDGATWSPIGIREAFPLPFPRAIKVQPGNPNVIFLTIGDTTPGRTGMVMRSKDTGKTWEKLSLPTEPNTTMWVVDIQPFDPQVIFAASRFGYLYRSEDGGDSWEKLWREFSEITSVVWVPA